MKGVSLSTIVVAHDSLNELRRSLPVLLEQLGPSDELIIVDNASSDDLAGALPDFAPRARLIPLAENVGFAAGVNRGAEQASGDLLALLNPDAAVQPGWVEAIKRPWHGPWAAWMGLVLLDGGKQINTSGGVLHFTGFGWAGRIGQRATAVPDLAHEVGFLSGACLAIPRAAWTEVGGFPEHFFMYCEDVDLSLRLRLRGGALGVTPSARVEHAYEFAKGERKWRLLERNRWATILRTYPALVLTLIFPALLATELAVWAVAFRGGWARAKAQATVDLLCALPTLLEERRTIQSSRRITAAQFAAYLTPSLDSPYFGRLGRQQTVNLAMKLYWRGVLMLLGGTPGSADGSEPVAAVEELASDASADAAAATAQPPKPNAASSERASSQNVHDPTQLGRNRAAREKANPSSSSSE